MQRFWTSKPLVSEEQKGRYKYKYISLLHVYLYVAKVAQDSSKFLLQHQGAFKQQHICNAEFTSHQVDLPGQHLTSLSKTHNLSFS